MLLVDSAVMAREGADDRLREALDARPDILVQLRDRAASAGEMVSLARRLRGICGAQQFLVNDRADVALLTGANGVHLPDEGLPVAPVRRLLPRSMLVGRSVHSVAAAREAENDGASYVLAGTIFSSRSHPDREPAGVQLISEICSRIALPVLAIGGMTPERVAECVRAGAAGVAAFSAVWDAPEPAAAVRSFRTALGEVRAELQAE